MRGFITRYQPGRVRQPGIASSLRGAIPISLLAAILLSAGSLAAAPQSAAPAESYRYLFENDRFTVPVQEVVVDGSGHGSYRYKKRDMEEMTLEFTVSPRVLGEIRALFGESGFLGSTENYQHRKDFSHLGTMTLTMREGERVRTTTFNYTDHQKMMQIVQIFRGLAVQESRIFEIETIRESDPISTPAQLRLLETELRSKSVADPGRFRPLLTELLSDESVPLIARNHARRLLAMIDK